jgi:hypothetical protein
MTLDLVVKPKSVAGVIFKCNMDDYKLDGTR